MHEYSILCTVFNGHPVPQCTPDVMRGSIINSVPRKISLSIGQTSSVVMGLTSVYPFVVRV